MNIFAPGLTLMELTMKILAALTVVFLVLPLHEYAHGFVASKLGDNTAKALGRLTLNPLVNFDPFGAIGVLLFNFGWSKPVPVDASNFKNPKRDMAIVAAAGPISNFCAAIIGGLMMNFLTLLNLIPLQIWANTFFMYYIYLNLGIAVFNLVPLPPLDGFRILEAFLPERFLVSYYKHHFTIRLVVFFLFFFGFLSVPLVFLENRICSFVVRITAFPFLLFA